MLLWISAGIYVLVSGVLLLLCKKYRFRIVIALSLIMLFLFDATPFSSVLSIGFSMLKTIVLVGIVLLIVTYFKRQHKQTP
ncbi:hypothetical protein HB848_09605 [Listeria rocourtiae]|uniref:hypothetical protein n=1 Tax=Listeria rocourtiae TaxID=647910 RepID=UPI001625C189|nr:hypothetical protein [Listeria rocourtiae]MBC1435595.1 hypothetical protein [Listeria rocourtiae]